MKGWWWWCLLFPSLLSALLVDPPSSSFLYSRREWGSRLPSPLAKDLEPWNPHGFDSSLYDDCPCPVTHGVLDVWLHQGHFYYGSRANRSAVYWPKLSRQWGVLEEVAQKIGEKYEKLPTIRLSLSVNSIPSVGGVCECADKSPPLLVLATTEKMPTMVRMPTLFFDSKWEEQSKGMYGKRVEWEEKREKGCWLGAANSFPGSKDRLDLMIESLKLAQKYPQLRDFFEIGPTDSLTDLSKWENEGNYDRDSIDLLKTFERMPRQKPTYFSGCKYNFHMPGHTHGGYSRAFQNLFPQNTAILRRENPWSEYYYDWLVEGEHILTFNQTNLKDKIFELKNDDLHAQKMAENAVQFYLDHLTWEKVVVYWEWLILSMIKFQNGETPLPGSEVCQCHEESETQCMFCKHSFSWLTEQALQRKEEKKQEKISRKLQKEKEEQEEREREEREEREERHREQTLAILSVS